MAQGEKIKIPRHIMPMQVPNVRAKNWEEVNIGFDKDMAMEEAKRCLSCKKPFCINGCPVRVNIPAFLKLVEEGNFLDAAIKIKENNKLPAICGRVCPQEKQCEKLCVLGKKGQPVAIGYLERFAADCLRDNGKEDMRPQVKSSGKRVAVIGSGPAGLTAAGDLAMTGHDVVIFEALHKPGGVLVYGIPDFRLPKEIVEYEINLLKYLGVEIVTNHIIGKVETVEELLERFDVVFLGTGAGLPYFLNIEGENLNGIYSANEFLTRIILMKARDFPNYSTPVKMGKNVSVIGCGNTAIDAARTALRIGAENVNIIYRRTKTESPAREEEVLHAEEEGVEFHFLTNPVRFIGDENGWLKAVECVKMELGEPDQSGRRRPIPIKGTEFIFETETAIIATGFGINPIVISSITGLEIEKGGVVKVNESGETNKERIFAGGDIITGGSTVISAMGQGRTAALSINEFLRD
ncbi:MAG: NADPH-dependent glutamate synthase [Nitrospirota bacterium]